MATIMPSMTRGGVDFHTHAFPNGLATLELMALWRPEEDLSRMPADDILGFPGLA